MATITISIELPDDLVRDANQRLYDYLITRNYKDFEIHSEVEDPAENRVVSVTYRRNPLDRNDG
jgi:hypothetical protein